MLSPEWFEAAAPCSLRCRLLVTLGDRAVRRVVVSRWQGHLPCRHRRRRGHRVRRRQGHRSRCRGSCSYDAFTGVLDGTTTADAAFMDGSFKVEGDHKAWLIDLRDVRTWCSARWRRSTTQRGALCVAECAIADQGHPETFEASMEFAIGQDGEVVEAACCGGSIARISSAAAPAQRRLR